MGKIEVDYERCAGQGICVGLVPEVFDLNEDDQAVLLEPTVPAGCEERVRAAIQACPTAALSLREDARTSPA